MELSIRRLCLVAVLLSAACNVRATELQAASSGTCNNATHHADPLVAYFLTGKDLKVRKVQDDPRGVLAELTTRASTLAPIMPYIVHDGDIIKHGMLDTARFLSDFQDLQAYAATRGGYGHAGVAAAAQCFSNFTRSVMDYAEDTGLEVPMMEAPSNAILFSQKEPSRAVVLDILDAKLKGDNVTLTVLFVQEPDMEPEGVCHRRQTTSDPHYHFPTDCSDVSFALDWVLPTAGGKSVEVPGAFSLQIKFLMCVVCLINSL